MHIRKTDTEKKIGNNTFCQTERKTLVLTWTAVSVERCASYHKKKLGAPGFKNGFL